MDRGLYAAASGGLLNIRRMEVLSNNLANVNTVGYKRQRLVTSEQRFADTIAEQVSRDMPRAKGDHDRVPGVTDIQTVTDFTQGPIKNTGNPLDVALARDNQYFSVQVGDEVAYTRAGNFTLNQNGIVVTKDGMPVLGEGGPITLPNGKPQITSSGEVLSDGEVIGKLRIVEVDNQTQLARTEGVRFSVVGNDQPRDATPDVVSGALEMPNVNIVEAMVQMISAQRAFESYTKTARSIDEMNQIAIRSGGTR